METFHSGFRCPTCGYALTGLRAMRCPECGEAVTLGRLERAAANRLDRGERIRMGALGAVTALGAIVCSGLAAVMLWNGNRAWEMAALFGAGGLLLLLRSVAYWAACMRGRRGGWVDELLETLRGGN